MANTGSLLPNSSDWAAAPSLSHAAQAAGYLALAALATQGTLAHLPAPSGLFLFFVAVLLAAVRMGFWIGIANAFAAFALYNFLFVLPFFTFAIEKPGDLLILAVFLVVAGLTGFLAGRLRDEVNAARSRATVLEDLSSFAGDLATAEDGTSIDALLRRYASSLAKGPAVILTPLGDGFGPQDALDGLDIQAAERAFRRQTPQDAPQAGQQGGRFAFVPLVQDGAVVLVLGHPRLDNDRGDREVPERAIEVICHQANLAIGRLRLARTAEDAHFRAAREAMRAALLTSLSHDLRTPLATILGAITSLRELADHLPPEARDDLALAIEQEAGGCRIMSTTCCK